MKKFYTHLIEIDTLIIELDKMDLSQEEKMHLTALIDSSLDHTILEAILSELNEEDKKTFLKHLVHDDHDKVWELLNSKIDNIEDKIKKAADELKKELHKDIEEAKRQKHG